MRLVYLKLANGEVSRKYCRWIMMMTNDCCLANISYVYMSYLQKSIKYQINIAKSQVLQNHSNSIWVSWDGMVGSGDNWQAPIQCKLIRVTFHVLRNSLRYAGCRFETIFFRTLSLEIIPIMDMVYADQSTILTWCCWWWWAKHFQLCTLANGLWMEAEARTSAILAGMVAIKYYDVRFIIAVVNLGVLS